MTPFSTKVLTQTVKEDQLALFFLGQAGFLLKTAQGKLIAIDPYLSNCCERYFGFKRLMPRLLEPSDLALDVLLISHAHYDHFDPDSVPALLSAGKIKLICARDVEAECQRLGLSGDITYLARNEQARTDGLTVTGMPCDHGELAPLALGLLIECAGKRLFYMGDTAYRPDYLEDPRLQNLDLLLLPINGAFGNLNEEQAARVVAKLQPRLAVPCHYWNFAEHGGNPGLFQKAMAELAPSCAYRLMAQGEGVLLP